MSRESLSPTEPPAGIADLPPDIQLVWHGVNDVLNLRQFLASEVPWCELDVSPDPDGRELVLRHDTFIERGRQPGEALLYLREALPRLLDRGKSIKLDFKAGGEWIEAGLALADLHHIPTDRLWLNGDLDLLGEAMIVRMAERYPGAVIQVPFTSLSVQPDQPEEFGAELARISEAGVNRFSVGWPYCRLPGLIDWLKQMGYEFNIYGVKTLDEFLQAVALHPRAVTADFNFPQWGYYGRGSGHGGTHFTYALV